MLHFAQYGLLTILTVFLVFHVCIILKVIPYSITWGGRLKSDTEMYKFETISILVNLFFISIILVHADIITFYIPKSVMTVILWLMAALFAFNTLGNIVSKNKMEQRLFTPITILLSIFSLILALGN